jgi:hypothetical protein
VPNIDHAVLRALIDAKLNGMQYRIVLALLDGVPPESRAVAASLGVSPTDGGFRRAWAGISPTQWTPSSAASTGPAGVLPSSPAAPAPATPSPKKALARWLIEEQDDEGRELLTMLFRAAGRAHPVWAGEVKAWRSGKRARTLSPGQVRDAVRDLLGKHPEPHFGLLKSFLNTAGTPPTRRHADERPASAPSSVLGTIYT